HTLRETLDWSYNLLDAAHQKLFARLSVFVGGGTIEAIEAVCDTREDLKLDLWEALEALVDSSLIRRMGAEGEPRFGMFETMREYAGERLAAAHEEAYTRKAHAAYYMVLAEDRGSAARREHTGSHIFDDELGNLRSALDWLAAQGEAEWGLRMVGPLVVYFLAHRLNREMGAWLKRLLALPQLGANAKLRRWGEYWLADVNFELEGTAHAAEGYRAAWDGFQKAGDREAMLVAAHRISHALQFEDAQESLMWSERSVNLARELGREGLLAGSLSNHADVLKLTGQHERAAQLYQEAARLFERAGDQENATWALNHEADLCLRSGQQERAEGLYTEALARFRALDYAPGVASCLHDLARLAAGAGQDWKARELFRQCLRLYGPSDVGELPLVFESVAAELLRGGRAPAALTILGAAAGVRERFAVVTLNPQARAAVEAGVEAARQGAGEAAAQCWMRGWNLPVEEAIQLALAEWRQHGRADSSCSRHRHPAGRRRLRGRAPGLQRRYRSQTRGDCGLRRCGRCEPRGGLRPRARAGGGDPRRRAQRGWIRHLRWRVGARSFGDEGHSRGCQAAHRARRSRLHLGGLRPRHPGPGPGHP